MKRGWVLMVLLLAATTALAGELAGVTLPESATVDGTTLVLNGMGLRKAYGIAKVYVGGLYLEEKTADAQAIIDSGKKKQMHMQFVRKVSREKLVDAWNEGFEGNVEGGLDALRDRIETFNSWMIDIEKGQSMVFTHLPGGGVVVNVAGENKGTIMGDDFASALWSVWLGPKPPTSALKKGLLGE
jgi:hypothetical protein